MYDTIIIGSGPAGMTAAIYASRREMNALVIGKELGGQMVWASEIENYPGFKSINAFELIQKMQDQVNSLGVEIKTAEVKKIEKRDDGTFKVFTNKDEYEARTVILAIGLSPRRLAIKGEEELGGKGVSYCANCDGPFYKDKIVSVIGGGNSALDAAEILSKIAKKVYLVHRRDEFKAFEALVNEVKNRENIELVLNSSPKEFLGEEKLEKMIVENKKTKETREIDVDGVFVEIGRIAHTDLLKRLVDRNEKKELVVDNLTKTRTEGLFACGDVTQVEFKQIPIAMGQATISALSAYQYLQTIDSEKNNS
ncbi:MAG TPA: thioredoxin-disulfide reductase [Patescibacteria group bacterium]|nr:thioredoxin-disulfide reductase [Patescibacteria group bacterium]